MTWKEWRAYSETIHVAVAAADVVHLAVRLTVFNKEDRAEDDAKDRVRLLGIAVLEEEASLFIVVNG